MVTLGLNTQSASKTSSHNITIYGHKLNTSHCTHDSEYFTHNDCHTDNIPQITFFTVLVLSSGGLHHL